MSNCSSFCTAAKCAELEAKISSLEQALEQLKASFETHINQPIPQAHHYDDPHVKSNLKLDGSFQADVLTLTVADGESQDTATISIPLPEIPDFPEPEPHVKSNLKLDGSFQADVLTLTVADGESQDTATISIPLPEIPDFPEPEPHVKSNLKLDGSFQADVLTLTVADGESSDTAQVFIDAEVINNFGGGGSNVSCDNLSNELTQCCANLSQEFQDCCSQMLTAIGVNLSRIQELEQYITIDITGEVKTNYKCEFPLDENDKVIPGYAEAEFKTIELAEENLKGLSGIYEYLKIISTNLDSVYSDVCKAIDPVSTLTVGDLYTHCLSNAVERSDFPVGEDGEEEYTKAVEEYLKNILKNSKYGYLVKDENEKVFTLPSTKIIEAPNNWITPILADFSLIQSRINNQVLCSISETEPVDVVSVVASPEVITNVSGKVLILHFVTLDNYPKRQAGSYPRSVQIPGALTEYSWDEHFKDLRWVQGNQYGELELEGYRKKVSGWFRDEAAGNAYFDAVLGLTTAVQKNRNFPKHSNPRTDIAVQVQRPHRAFIESVNEQGRAICHVKYRPVI